MDCRVGGPPPRKHGGDPTPGNDDAEERSRSRHSRKYLARGFVSRYSSLISAVPKGFGVHGPFARRSLQQRIVALVAAYAIALGGVLASLAAATAAAAPGPGTVTCHSQAAAEPSPSQNDKTGKVCVASCCIGCMMLTAALPPPPLKTIGTPQSAARLLVLPPVAAVPAGSSSRSHQSRAPPLRA